MLVTWPPDSVMINDAAATSQGASPNSQNPSSRPHAKYARSIAAAPQRLRP